MLFDQQRTKRWARWVYGTLAVVFAVSYIGFGVGGSMNFTPSDIFGDDAGSTGAPDDTGNIKDLRSQVENNPKAAAAWLALAQAYSAENRSQESVNAYERYVALKPQDADALSAMANVMLGEGARLERVATEYYNASVLASQASPGQQPFFGGTSALGQALQNPFTNAQNSQASARSSAWQATATTLQTQANDWYQRALEPYASLTKLRPDDAQSWLYYGDASQQAGETALAITAYNRFLELAPDDIDAPRVKDLVKQLKEQQSGSGSSISGVSG